VGERPCLSESFKTHMKNGKMRAVGVLPGKRAVSLVSHSAPEIASASQVKIRTIEVGICGTDREICSFAYGTPPDGSEFLVLGHEALGEVVEVGASASQFKVGDLVVPSVRRPCPHRSCSPCQSDRQDFCFTGDFTERGIKMTHGFLTEYFVDDEKHLNLVPADLRDVGVLVEPLTVAEKALAQVWQVQQRLPWENLTAGKGKGYGKTAVVLGAGPVGILGCMTLLVNGFTTFVYSRSPAPNPKSELVNSLGAKYISAQTVPLARFAAEVGPVDLVYEAAGVAQISFDVMKLLALNGIFVFTGIPAEKPAIPIDADCLMRDLVLKNQVIIGTVNADRPAFEGAIRDLGVFKRRWPEALGSVITGRFQMEDFEDLLLDKGAGIKSVITLE